MNIRQYLSSKGLQWKEIQRPKGLIAVMNCPQCGDNEKKFAISLNDGAFSCLHLNNCGIKGSWWDFQKLFGDKPVSLDGDRYILIPKTYKQPEIKPDALKDDGNKFFIDRGFNKNTIEKFKVGQKNGAIMLPTFVQGKHVGTKFRAITEKKFWNEQGTGPYLFNQDNCTGKAIAICEGHFDCMALDQYGIPAVSVPNGVGDATWIELDWDYIEGFERVYLFFDNDQAGQDAVKGIVNRIGQWRCYNVILPYKDANECLIKGITKEQITQCIEDAKEFNPEKLKKLDHYIDEIYDMRQNPQKRYGIQTPWKGLNNLLKGWREQELTIWSGRSGSGKSTILNSVILGLLNKKEKVIIASLEMQPKAYLDWMLTTLSDNYKMSLDDMKVYARERFTDLYIYDAFGDSDPDELINVFEFAARKYGVKHFVVDSLMKIRLMGSDRYEVQKNFCNELIDGLAVKHTGHCHLVVHPRKSFKDSDRPEKMDVAGSGDITNLAHNVLIMYRTTIEEKEEAESNNVLLADNELYVKKNRQWGLEGSIKFLFDSDTKKFKEA